jgi:hypothetical protein
MDKKKKMFRTLAVSGITDQHSACALPLGNTISLANGTAGRLVVGRSASALDHLDNLAMACRVRKSPCVGGWQ